MAFALLSLVLVLAAFALLLVYTVRTGISPVPTTPRVAAAMFALVPPETRGVIYELGSGWGNLASGLAKRFPDCPVVAYELSPLPWLVSVLWRRLAGRPNLTLRRADFFAAPLGDAAVVCCYLYPGAMRRLRPKFENELAAGALVLSNSFLVPGWVPAEVRIAGDAYATKVYLYRMPPELAEPVA
jgi:hypothetical protein